MPFNGRQASIKPHEPIAENRVWLILCNHAFLGYEAPKQRIFSLQRALQQMGKPVEIYRFSGEGLRVIGRQKEKPAWLEKVSRYRLRRWWAKLVCAGDLRLLRDLIHLWLQYRRVPLLIFSSYPSFGNLVLGGLLQKIHPDALLVFDYRDYCAGVNERGLFAKCFQAILRWLRKGCSAEVTVSHGHRNSMGRMAGTPFHIVRNGFAEGFGNVEKKNSSALTKTVLRIAYFGTLEEPRRSIRPLVSALRSNRPLGIEIDIWGGLDQASRDALAGLGLDSVMTWKGVCLHSDVPVKMALYDAFLHILWHDGNSSGFISSKVYEYAFWAKPILTLGPQTDQETARLVRRLGGVSLGEGTREIIKSLQQLPKLIERANQNRCISARLFERESMWKKMIHRAHL